MALRTATQHELVGHIDTIGESGSCSAPVDGTVGRGGLLIVRGWALGPARIPVDDLVIRIGEDRSVAVTRIIRNDLIPIYGENAVGGGFIAMIAMKAEEGQYSIALIATAGPDEIELAFDRYITVTRPSNPLEGLRGRQAGWRLSVDGVRFENDESAREGSRGAYLVEYQA